MPLKLINEKKDPSALVRFSWKRRFSSFRYAFEGIIVFFRTEHNAWIHLGATILVVFLAWFIQLSETEWILIILVTGLVWITELFNTAIEKAMDLLSMEKNLTIKRVKDLSAAAVLVAAIIAFITGCLIFIPKLI